MKLGQDMPSGFKERPSTARTLLFFLPSWILVCISFRLCLPHKTLHILAILIATITAACLYSYGTWKAVQAEPAGGIPSVDSTSDKESWTTPLVIGACILTAVLIAALTGVRHDHISYMEQWAVVNAGKSPWSEGSNTYFPLHAFLAPLSAIHPLLVKSLFTLATIGSILFSALGPVAPGEKLTHQAKLTLFLAIALCPFIMVGVYSQGVNDSLSASFLFLAMILASRRQNGRTTELLSGISLGLGACLKVYPLFTAPFFIVKQRRIRWAFLVGCGATVATVFAIAYGLWGVTIVAPFLRADNRGATFISPFNALSNLHIEATQYSSLLMLLSLVGFFIYYLIRNIDFPSAVMLGLSLPLFFYRVGHIQFLFYVAIFTPFMIRHWSSIHNRGTTSKLSAALLTWVGFLNWFQMQCTLNCGMTLDTPSRIFRDHGGWPYALVLAFMFFTFFQYGMPSPGCKPYNQSR